MKYTYQLGVSMNTADPQYLQLLSKLVTKLELALQGEGSIREDRTGVGAVSLFGEQMRFDLSQSFPTLTTKKVHFPSVVSELLWFLKGDTNIKYLLEHNNHIWTDWRYKAYLQDHAKRTTPNSPKPLSMAEFESLLVNDPTIAEAYGDIGKGYGHQWRKFGEVVNNRDHNIAEAFRPRNDVIVKGFDQISWVINEIKTNPTSRRLLVSGWNPQEMGNVDLPPCHTLFQFFVEPMSLNERKYWVDHNYVGGGLQAIADYCNTGITTEDELRKEEILVNGFDNLLKWVKAPTSKLSCQLYQRSADFFLGVPFNISSYALLTHIIAKECGLGLGEFVWTGGDVHLYANHLDQAKEQCLRTYEYDTPKLKPFAHKPFDQYEPNDFELIDYKSHPAIKAPVAV